MRVERHRPIKTSDGLSEMWGRFVHPPVVCRPTPIWWWSGEKLDMGRLRWQLERFAEGGIGALVVLNLAPSGPLVGCDADDPPFFSDAWWHVFRQVCDAAEALGLKLYFYDQIGFSGANIQGEIVTRRPEFVAHTLQRVTRVTQAQGAVVECPSEGEPLAACAMPVDGAGRCAGPPIPVPLQGRNAMWPGEDQPYRVMLAYRVSLGFNYFSPDACRELRDTIHGVYEREVGEHFGGAIVGSFQDELPSMPTWSEDFAAQFAARRGYDLIPHLSALWEDYGTEARRVRRDYHATRATLAEEAFFQPLYQWHAERGLICGFDQQDSARAGFPIDTVDQYADYPRTHRWFGAPGSDHHGDAKIHSSLAHAYGHQRVWVEAFHSSGWGGTLEETFDWLLPWLRAGANLYNPHAVYYSTRGGWWEWAPPSTDWRQPYWRHHDHFAAAVARLCSMLTLGRHVCEVAVLHPTATVQAGATLDGPTEAAKRAHHTYLRLVGQLRWYDTCPGVLDRACRDFDVLDDASLAAGTVREGGLRVGDEVYSAVVLPGCTEVDDAGAEQLANFAAAGGTLVAVEAVPAALTALTDSGTIRFAANPDDVPALFDDLPSRVQAPVPTLLRETDDATVLFVPATGSRVTQVTPKGGESQPWTRVSYTFDPADYARAMTVTVRGVTGEPELWQPYSATTRRLAWRQRDDAVDVEVPLDDAPGALVVWRANAGWGHVFEDQPTRRRRAGVGTSRPTRQLQAFDGHWRVQLEPTLDNRWGDFAYPKRETPFPVQRWSFAWRREETTNEDWSARNADDAKWDLVRATFGSHGEWRTRDDRAWHPLRYSTSRGIAQDSVHEASLGPKGHVPEEFLDFGDVRAGQVILFRTVVAASAPRTCHLAVAASASKEAWVNGKQLMSGHDQGYLAVHPVPLDRGRNLLQLRLTATDDVRLRGSFAFVTDPQLYRRPEWMSIAASAQMESTVSFQTEFDVGEESPALGMIHLGSATPCRLYVNDAEVVRQGGFYPYFTSFEISRIGVYDVRDVLRSGSNRIRVDASDLGQSVAVLVDAVTTLSAGGGATAQSGSHWRARRDGVDVEMVLLRTQPYDPAWGHQWRRPHPLPQAAWLEGERAGQDTVLPLRAAVPSFEQALYGKPVVRTVDPCSNRRPAEWLRFLLPPGASQMRVPVQGAVRVWIDGVEVPSHVNGDCEATGQAPPVEVALPGVEQADRVCAMRVEPAFGYTEGALLDGPAEFDVTEGTMPLGNWEEHGLADYSGGVRYVGSLHHRKDPDRLDEQRRVLLDLGRVRGTAEVWVNEVAAGVRIWSPYHFDITELLRPGDNDLEILVLNTLGPYMQATSPTHFVFPGQTASGLFGPVQLLAEKASERRDTDLSTRG